MLTDATTRHSSLSFFPPFFRTYSSVDPSQWLLFIMEATAAGHGRGLVKGRIYTQEGKLAVVVQQEGVVRQAIKSKL